MAAAGQRKPLKQHFVVDASVILKWYLNEELQAEANAVKIDFGFGKIHLMAPQYALVEAANRLERQAGFGTQTLWRLGSLLETRPLSLEALVQSFELVRLDRRQGGRHFTVYDAIYVQLALVEQVTLLTADEAQAKAGLRAKCKVTLLQDYL